MSKLLQFVSVWEFLLRYNVIVGVIVAMIGSACCFSANMFNKNDGGNRHQILVITGLVLLLLGMVAIALPLEATLYRG